MMIDEPITALHHDVDLFLDTIVLTPVCALGRSLRTRTPGCQKGHARFFLKL